MPDVRTLAVGSPYLPVPAGGWVDGAAIFEWRRSGPAELVLSFRRPTAAEVDGARKGAAWIGCAAVRSVVYLTWRIDGVGDGEAPYSIHLLAPEDRPDLEAPAGPATRLLVTVVLVDSATGLVRALRALSLHPRVTAALFAAVRLQATADVGPPLAAYAADLAELPRRWPSAALRELGEWRRAGE